MRLHWIYLLVPGLAVATCTEDKAQETLCDPGTEIFCRCRGGDAGTKTCQPDGESFGPCGFADGECTEVPEPEPTTTDGVGGYVDPVGTGGAGGEPPNTCSHDLCEKGAALEPGCHPCVDFICQAGVDPYCCDKLEGLKGEWDEMCISEVTTKCMIPCSGSVTTSNGPGPGSGGGGEGGAPATSTTSTGPGGGDCYTVGGADPIIAGDLVITEIMNNPAAVTDDKGEWFEILNASVPAKCIDLKGLLINSLNDAGHTVGANVIVPVDGYAVLGRSTTGNGNVPVDYGYGPAIALGNGDDSLSLLAAGKTIDATSYKSAVLNPNGASRSLDPGFFSASKNDDDTNWCAATTTIPGSTDKGTPGAKNPPCP
jgi:hypothetical protein